MTFPSRTFPDASGSPVQGTRSSRQAPSAYLLPSVVVTVVMFLAVAAVAVVVSAQPAQAQGFFWGNDDQQQLELFVDSRGRRFLVDPYSGEVFGRANRHARFTRRDKIRAQREFRSSMRNTPDRDQYDDDGFEQEFTGSRRQRRNQALARRDYEAPFDQGHDLRPGETRRFNQNRDGRRSKPRQLASLPVEREPIVRPVVPRGMSKPKYSARQIAELQVVLDRAGFSPGVIDGRWGSNVARAAHSWKQAKKNRGNLANAKTLQQLVQNSGGAVFKRYTITRADLGGPFVAAIPVDYAQKARLKTLAFTSVEEMLAERFHMSLAYLQQLNPDADFRRAGTAITVIAPGQEVRSKVHYLVADKAQKQVRAFDRNGNLVSSYPATIGSASTPSPSGTHTIDRIARNPEYTYNPEKNFQQGENNRILRIAPGPNGPVGSVWIALSKPSYGIHGTPNPRAIGKTNSHGCIRLTNWDAQELAALVRPGVTVEFVE